MVLMQTMAYHANPKYCIGGGDMIGVGSALPDLARTYREVVGKAPCHLPIDCESTKGSHVDPRGAYDVRDA